MKMTNANLLRLAGLSALIAGLCYVFVGVFHPANAVVSVSTTRWAVVHVVACAMSFFGVLGLAGIYARQALKTGWLGLVGFLMLSLWMVLIMGFSFVEAFVLPHLVTASPEFIDGWMKMFNGGTSTINMGVLPSVWTSTAPLYILGGLLFGIATFRARILPRWAGVLLAVGTLLAPLASQLSLAAMPKIAIPTGLALAWMGYALMTERTASGQTPSSQAVEAAAV
ncbi:hypothetical protein ACPPVT_17275 [Angustibacter sp. McL0619]|uniref:hypothetical protein n=1 Tax=Angustibacter sp. McL0619 TaxID=3415676 RepID=UPI003CF9DC63